MHLGFVSGNKKKLAEVQQILADGGIVIEPKPLDRTEK